MTTVFNVVTTKNNEAGRLERLAVPPSLDGLKEIKIKKN